MILTVEHTSGGEPCHACEREQDMKSINLKIHARPDGTYPKGRISRIRLCKYCSIRLRDDMIRAVK